MNVETLGNTIRGKFNTLATAQSWEVHYDNEKGFEQPEGTWIRFSIIDGESVQASLGSSKRHRSFGVAVAQIFTKIGIGDKEAREIADLIVTAFRSTTEDSVTYRTPYITVLGRVEDQLQVNVTIPYYIEDIQSS